VFCSVRLRAGTASTMEMSHVKLSSQEHIAPGHTYADRIRNLQRMGFEGVELTIGHQGIMEGTLQPRVKEIAAVGAETGIEVSVITTKVYDLLDQDPKRRNAAMGQVRDGLEVAAEIGAKGIVLVPRFGPPSLPDLSPLATAHELENQIFVLQLRELAQDAERLGVEIILEPLHRYLVKFLRTVEHAVEICEQVASPAVKVMVDNFQSYNEEVSIADAIVKAGDHLAHVHISDNNRRLPPQGTTDFAPILAALKRIGYTGYLSFECEVPGDPEPQLAAAATHMKRLMKQKVK
jgi:sugar phosphate isomerase/epimerase